jgi:hypothetical protein
MRADANCTASILTDQHNDVGHVAHADGEASIRAKFDGYKIGFVAHVVERMSTVCKKILVLYIISPGQPTCYVTCHVTPDLGVV